MGSILYSAPDIIYNSIHERKHAYGQDVDTDKMGSMFLWKRKQKISFYYRQIDERPYAC